MTIALLLAGTLIAAPIAPPVTEVPRVRSGDTFTPIIAFRGDAVSVGLVLDGQPREMLLRPHEVRSEGLHVRVSTPGGALIDAPLPRPTTFRADFDGGAASMSVVDGRLRGMIRLGEGKDERTFGVEPLGHGWHISYDITDVIPTPGSCGSDVLQGLRGHAVEHGGSVLRDPGDCLRTVVAAFDADFEMFQINGSDVDATIADVEGVMNDVNFIYERDTGITHLIGTLIVRSSAADPYTSTDPFTRLDQFRSEWNGNQGGVERDLAHFFTGANLDGGVIGVAWVGVLCDAIDYSYGMSETYYGGSYAERVGLTAHELGHNWGAGHCDGDDDCAIMCSYINGCPGGIDNFGERSIAAICDWAETHDCDGELCECTADLDEDGDADADDFFAFLDLFAAGADDADLDGDGDRDADDFFLYLDAFAAC
ncbi:MAG: zinc-dependent metalloprotease [Phycisphaeraceae bacterium]|nr:zinc-dependent metalloprotease [Phycisphaeraceae bacterium]